MIKSKKPSTDVTIMVKMTRDNAIKLYNYLDHVYLLDKEAMVEVPIPLSQILDSLNEGLADVKDR